MIGYRAPAETTSSIYVCNLPPGTDETLLAEHFGTIGVIKKDKRTSRFKIWIYRDKTTNEPKGDATVTYEDPHAAKAAVEWFDNKDFHGNLIRVSIAESKMKDSIEQQPVVEGGNDVESVPGEEGAPTDEVGGAGGFGAGRGRGRGELGGKAWQQEGDWPCPNPSCGNINFAFRGSCNRCSASRPSSGAGGGGGGRGRGRAGDSSGRGGARAGGLFGPNDWNCPMCGNTNWAKRTKCNICNTTKPGHTEGGIREGRAGGYKEFDEAEIEETKRRRKELEEDDGEMYDEFGNLKKKFRLKAKQGETTTQGNLGSLGWDKEELGFVENDKRKSRSSRDDHHNGYRKSDDEYSSRSVEREKGRDTEKGRDREREKGRERDRDRERARSKERDYRDRDRERDRDRRAR